MFYKISRSLRPLDSDLEGLPKLSLSRSYDLPLCLSGSFVCHFTLPKGWSFSGGEGGGLTISLRSFPQPASPELEAQRAGYLAVLSMFTIFSFSCFIGLSCSGSLFMER